jgi:hypothetical protein
LDSKKIEKLKNETLFRDHLLEDIKKGEVFPAIRHNAIDFYYKGNLLFEYNKKFRTHIKYASIYVHNKNDPYISEDDLKDIEPLKNFSSGESYRRIKETCSLYAKPETEGVSKIIGEYSFVKKSSPNVLDIEVAFSNIKDIDEIKKPDTKVDKIDLLLQDNNALKFIEVKRYVDGRLWTEEVKNQIGRYQSQIHKRKTEILDAYSNYVKIMNQLFENILQTPLTTPKILHEKVPLLVFGYDRDQRKDLKGFIEKNFEGYPTKEIGGMGNLKIETLWNSS